MGSKRHYNSRIKYQTKNIINIKNFPQVSSPAHRINTTGLSNALSQDIAEIVDHNDNATIYSTFRISVNR
jgi:hypothetical protein